ncbi:LLM class flavin-dependent oxidoreductase [Streptomyces sp. SID486]|uniref:LLM class flavin-dependent oxidoreductase n=1 Tax=Streptomyces sp. SID486 TaxID=2690264 RepID=UPI0031F61BAA
MSARYGGLLHLAAALDQPGAPGTESFVELARLAERGGLDFVTLDDSAARPGADALGVLCRVAPATRRIGLVPTVTTADPEPLRAQGAVATLDRLSRGRAGWRLDLGAPGRSFEGEAVPDRWFEGEAAPGRWFEGEAVPGRSLGGEAVPGRSFEGEAVQGRSFGGAAGTGGLSGGGRPRWGDFTGGAFPGQDPPAAPRPPQGRPVHVVDVTDDHARTVAARYADVALVRATTPVQAAGERDRLLEQAGSFGRRPGSARILVSLLVDLGDGERAAQPGHGGGGPRPTGRGPLYRGGPVDLAELIAAWHAAGVADGFHLVPVEPRRDLERLVNGTAALLQHRGLFRTFYPGSTLREHLGLPRPVTPYATSGATLTTTDRI